MPLPVTEDTPPDMLAGAMELKVLLPSGRTVAMSVERSTPMMDLLVQLTTAHKLSLAGHMTVALAESGAALHHLPSTPIGALDTRLLHVVPRTSNISTLQRARPAQPFQSTFRLQVHLPRNQLFVTRVSATTCLGDVLRVACVEKNLDPAKYELRHPANLQEQLLLTHTLGDYRLQEVTMVARRSLGAPLTPSDIMALHKQEEKRRQQVKANGATTYTLPYNKSRTNVQQVQSSGSVSSDSLNGRSISPARSDESVSRSVSPLAPEPPKRAARKRRPAPKPPVVPPASHPSEPPPQDGVTSHSRTSSDSSGYHEASVLSETTDSRANGDSSGGTLPRRSKLPSANHIAAKQHSNNTNHSNLSRSLSNLTATAGIRGQNMHSASTTSLASQGQPPRRKKAAPPPPPGAVFKKPSVTTIAFPSVTKTTINETIPETHEEAVKTLNSHSNVGIVEGRKSTSINVESSNIVAVEKSLNRETVIVSVPRPDLVNHETDKLIQIATNKEKLDPVESSVIKTVPVESNSVSQLAQVKTVPLDISVVVKDVKIVPVEECVVNPVPVVAASNTASVVVGPRPTPSQACEPYESCTSLEEWEYHLPAPPSAFRDLNSPTTTDFETIQLADTQVFHDTTADTAPVVVEDMAPIVADNAAITVKQYTSPIESRTVIHQSADSLTKQVMADMPITQGTVVHHMTNTSIVQETEVHHTANMPVVQGTKVHHTADTPIVQGTTAVHHKANTSVEQGTTEVLHTVNVPVVQEPEVHHKANTPVVQGGTTAVHHKANTHDVQETTEVHHKANTPIVQGTEVHHTANTHDVQGTTEVFHKANTPIVQGTGVHHTANVAVVQETADVKQGTTHAASNDSWEPQMLRDTSSMRAKFNNGDLRLSPDGITKEVFKVNPIFDACPIPDVCAIDQRATPDVRPNDPRPTPETRPILDQKEIIERSKSLITRSSTSDLTSANALKNFTISSYEKPKNADSLFREPLPLARTNSYTSANQTARPNTVKRSTSYISLVRPYSKPFVRTKSISNLVLEEEAVGSSSLRKTSSDLDVSHLASLNVMKSILPQISQAAYPTDSISTVEPVEVIQPVEMTKPANLARVTEPSPSKSETKPFVYLGPPAINFGSWGERPRSQVSLKSDKDYRIGRQSSNHNLLSDNSTNLADNTDARLTKIETTPLTMRIVSHTTTHEQKRSSFAQNPRSSSTVDVVDAESQSRWKEETSETSRLPIVRAVELKKTVPEHFVQLRNKSSTLLNVGSDNVAQVSVNNYQSSFNRHSYMEGVNVNVNVSQGLSKSVSTSHINMEPFNNNQTSNKLVNVGNKKYTSVVGINRAQVPSARPNSSTISFNAKPMPIVKGFRVTETGEQDAVSETNVKSQPLKTINGIEQLRAKTSWSQRNSANEKMATETSWTQRKLSNEKIVSEPLVAQRNSYNEKTVADSSWTQRKFSNERTAVEPMATQRNSFIEKTVPETSWSQRKLSNERTTAEPLVSQRNSFNDNTVPETSWSQRKLSNERTAVEPSWTQRKLFNEKTVSDPFLAQRNSYDDKIGSNSNTFINDRIVSSGSSIPEPPKLPAMIKFKKPVQRPLEKQFTNPRDALMDAIKNFGGQDSLTLKNDAK